ncbi:lactate utilization protein [Candidatus Woesearchaeota archaeon]|nr:lactate utilization protein [Candidatus Woesearchaeota archaeon]
MNPAIEKTIESLKKNKINAYFAEIKEEALKLALSLIPENSSIGFGGSMSVEQIGLVRELFARHKNQKCSLYYPYLKELSRQESLELRHKGMAADVYVTGTNAVTEKGELVNLDGYGNRVAAQICGPKKVIIISGKNKIVKDYDAAIKRIRTIAAPLNAKRLNKDTPCVKTGYCMDCNSEQRICNFTTIIHGSYDKERLHVIIVDEELGL